MITIRIFVVVAFALLAVSHCLAPRNTPLEPIIDQARVERETRLKQAVAYYQNRPAELVKRAETAAQDHRAMVKHLHREAHSLRSPITAEGYKGKMISRYEHWCKGALEAINVQVASHKRSEVLNTEYLTRSVLSLEKLTESTRSTAARIRVLNTQRAQKAEANT